MKPRYPVDGDLEDYCKELLIYCNTLEIELREKTEELSTIRTILRRFKSIL